MKKFTLIELLVVIAIIGILASLLLPVLSKARKRSKQIVCINQVKQIGSATYMYTSDNDGYYPLNPPQHRLATYLGGNPTDADMTIMQLRKSVPSEVASASRLAAQVWECPTDIFNNYNHTQFGNSYSLNGFTNANGPETGGTDDQTIIYGDGAPLYTRQVTDVAGPTILLGCNISSGPSRMGFNSYPSSAYDAVRRWRVVTGLLDGAPWDAVKSSWSKSHHNKNSFNAVFTDGHAENLTAPSTVNGNINIGTRDGKNYSMWAIDK